MSENETVQAAPPPQVVQQIVATPRSSGWQLDRSVGVAVIVAVLAQLVVGIWYASNAYSQLADHEKRIVHLEQSFEEKSRLRDEQMRALNDVLSELRERLAGIESGVKYLAEERAPYLAEERAPKR